MFLFASSVINAIFRDAKGVTVPSGVIEGNPHQLVNQQVGVLIAWVLAIVDALGILKIVDVVVGLRVSENHEIQGLDLS